MAPLICFTQFSLVKKGKAIDHMGMNPQETDYLRIGQSHSIFHEISKVNKIKLNNN